MGKLSDIVAKLKQVKHIELYALISVVAVVLVVYFACVSCKAEKTDSGDIVIDGSDYCTAMQLRLERIVSEISGVGDASIVINWDRSVSVSFTSGTAENPKATGAIIVCDGGADTKVKLDVTYAVSTLLDLSIEKIMVYPKS